MAMDIDDAWFVRRRSRTRYRIVPCRWQGWAVTAAFVALIFAAGIAIRSEHAIVHLVVNLVIVGTYLVIVWRTSAPAQ